MTLPRWLARFNRRVTNVVLPRIAAGRVPGFAVLHHRGRRSGRTYRTPISAFARPGGFTIALTYGPDTDWVKNVLAAGTCELEFHGQRVRVTQPHLIVDTRQRGVPPVVRPLLRLMGVKDFLDLTAV